MTCRILVLNGPNLGHLGQRQPHIYGTQGMRDLPDLVETLMGQAVDEVELLFFQANGEGQIIDRLEQAHRESVHGVALNAGAYTHTSLALADCLAWIDPPCVEVHLSNILARSESMRHVSLIAPQCIGVISGFGLLSYALAIQTLWLRWTTSMADQSESSTQL
ncbi:3-dehydroquinate dehydratase [Desulfonatronum thiosulfatophilum]|uniref:3-dehydroquinate dehydratase n=1 Tax=Desulfonatronum thiosulfatophilum TaxID=617002 RepID=A0A1G6DRC5_9BACT|nr:type II 3-dehydroquinate dehydratase [Desulfonatronum thiosulfatophilum]SDB47652.1 3-dehydroquinate dehydratase [Desulfonatronum thiosulfatophilum]